MAGTGERLADEIPTLVWKEYDGSKGASACGFDFPGLGVTDGENRGLPGSMAKGYLADTDWGRALKAVGEVATGYGFEGRVSIVDRPGDHKAIFKDGYDAKFSFGTAANTLLTLRTGCHLTAKALPPRPPPERQRLAAEGRGHRRGRLVR
ncbi:LppA family lipoprotein [Crossiella cryophila]|uniref:LppA family lipoprotein n=1 Tax=Crossiella cryophila TaxID=43355 RepID=UPI00161E3475